MRILITDTGMIWNKDNPFLEKFKDILLVVCLDGKKATDKYNCFVSPYKAVGLGTDNFGIESGRFKALASVAKKLNSRLRYYEDIVFLADNEPSTLYPYYALKDINEYNNLHLVAMPPLKFEINKKIKGFGELISDLSHLDSFLFYDINKKLDEFAKGKNLFEFLDFVKTDLGNMLPCILNGIYHINNYVNSCEKIKKPCFFDFASMKYVSLKKGFYEIDITNVQKIISELDFPVELRLTTLGILVDGPSFPNSDEYVKNRVERPVARLDGKKICNVLRNQRIKLAAVNNISFESEECPSIGPCAGTCEKCDREAEFLREAMQKIPREKRVYPEFDAASEVRL